MCMNVCVCVSECVCMFVFIMKRSCIGNVTLLKAFNIDKVHLHIDISMSMCSVVIPLHLEYKFRAKFGFFFKQLCRLIKYQHKLIWTISKSILYELNDTEMFKYQWIALPLFLEIFMRH